jgi:hypothetical protein
VAVTGLIKAYRDYVAAIDLEEGMNPLTAPDFRARPSPKPRVASSPCELLAFALPALDHLSGGGRSHETIFNVR